MSNPRPQDIRIGDIVQYTTVDMAGRHHANAALVVDTLGGSDVALQVFPSSGGMLFCEMVEFSSFPAGDAQAEGKWSFPVH